MVHIRTIEPADNKELASIIRATMTEFGVNKPNTVFDDPTTDHLFELFQKNNSIYYVAFVDWQMVGGGGIYPSNGLPAGTCELCKMWLLPHARGIGLGKQLIERCMNFAESAGYTHVYLETMPELTQAIKLYERFGFAYLSKPLGNTGHTGCAKWMLKRLVSGEE